MTTRSLATAAMLVGAATLLGCTGSRSRYSSKEAAPTTTARASAEEAADAWNGPLRKALAGCDGLEIHDDDTPWVVTVEGADRVQQVVDMIRLDPERSGKAFCCTGPVTFTFARQGTHRASLEYLYGTGWRWHHGPWAGDGVPTMTSALALARWLAERGSPVDLEKLQRSLEELQDRIDRERPKPSDERGVPSKGSG